MARDLAAVLAVAGAMVVGMQLAALAASHSPAGSPGAGEPWIVYNGDARIRLVRTDGTEDHAVFTGLTPGDRWHPDWSPDGRSIVFAADDADGTRDLWMGPVDGSSAERIYDCAAPCAWSDDPAWSPDGGSILFQRGTAVDDAGMGVGTVDVLTLGSGAITTLFTGAETEYLYVPRWAPEMDAFVMELDRFASGRLDESQVDTTTIAIVELTTDPPTMRELLPTDERAGYPDWGPGGEIVFAKPLSADDPHGPMDLYTVDRAGGDVRRVTTVGDDGRHALQPSWTPDGSGIIFVEQDDFAQGVRMATIRPDGTGLSAATSGGDLVGTHPRLQPASVPALE